jgi:hypothetical protein
MTAEGKQRRLRRAVAVLSARTTDWGNEARQRAHNESILAGLYRDLAERMLHAAAEVRARAVTRDEDAGHTFHGNQWTGGIGGGPKPTTVKATTAKAGVHELLSSGHAFTKQELMAIAGVKTEKLFADYMAMLKNPKYAGPAGALKIEKKGDLYYVAFPDGTPAPKPPPGTFDPPRPTPAPTPAPTPRPTPAPTPPPTAAPTPAPTAAPRPAQKVAQATPTAPVARPVHPPSRWVPVKNAKEATKQAVAQGWADGADFGSIHADAANELMGSVADHFGEFPALKRAAPKWFFGTTAGYVKKIHNDRIELVKKALLTRIPDASPEMVDRHVKMYAGRKPKAPTKSWALAWNGQATGGRAVTVNQSFCSDPAEARTVMKRNVDVGFHPPGCDTYKSVMDHEMGHQLDYLLDLRKHPEVQSMYSEALRARASHTIPEDKAVSKYGIKNPAEFIAELWAESKNAPNPRPLAQRMASIVRSEYAKKHG